MKGTVAPESSNVTAAATPIVLHWAGKPNSAERNASMMPVSAWGKAAFS